MDPWRSSVHVPRVSIGLPVYNGEKYLRFAIDSILGQDFTDFELILSDNASTDGTGRICSEYASNDTRIRYFKNERNLGAAPNHIRVFELARAPLFKWASYDDIHLPSFLRKCVETMDGAPPSVVLVAPRAELIDENGEKSPTGWLPERLETKRPEPHERLGDVLRNVAWATAQYGIYRADKLRKTRLVGAFPCSDYVLLAEIALLGEIREVPEVLFQRRYHPSVSHMANTTQAQFMEWFDTSKARKGRRSILPVPLVPRWRVLFELQRSALRAPMKATEKLRCCITALRIWSWRERVRLEKEWRSHLRLKQRIRRLLQALRVS